MNRFSLRCGLRLVFGAALLAALCGCDLQQGLGGVNAFDFVQTVLLGVTAAGSVAILQNV